MSLVAARRAAPLGAYVRSLRRAPCSGTSSTDYIGTLMHARAELRRGLEAGARGEVMQAGAAWATTTRAVVPAARRTPALAPRLAATTLCCSAYYELAPDSEIDSPPDGANSGGRSRAARRERRGARSAGGCWGSPSCRSALGEPELGGDGACVCVRGGGGRRRRTGRRRRRRRRTLRPRAHASGPRKRLLGEALVLLFLVLAAVGRLALALRQSGARRGGAALLLLVVAAVGLLALALRQLGARDARLLLVRAARGLLAGLLGESRTRSTHEAMRGRRGLRSSPAGGARIIAPRGVLCRSRRARASQGGGPGLLAWGPEPPRRA